MLPRTASVKPQAKRARLRLGRKRGVEQRELGADGAVVIDGVARGAVEHVHECARALAVPQELVPQAHARMRALQQPYHARPRAG